MGDQNFLVGTNFHWVTELNFVEFENNADGDCLYESILDSAYHYIHADHDLKRLFGQQDNIGQSRDKEDAESLKRQLGTYIDILRITEPSRSGILEEAHKRVTSPKVWGSTDELNYIANFYNICIFCHTLPDNVWSVSVPRDTEINACKDFLIIRNKGTKMSKKGSQKNVYASSRGLHFVALIHNQILPVSNIPPNPFVHTSSSKKPSSSKTKPSSSKSKPSSSKTKPSSSKSKPSSSKSKPSSSKSKPSSSKSKPSSSKTKLSSSKSNHNREDEIGALRKEIAKRKSQ